MAGSGSVARRWRRMRWRAARWLVRIRRRVPPGLRLPLGLLLMVGGVFGALPVLGFWMLPLGVAVAALDVRPAWDALRRRLGGAEREPDREASRPERGAAASPPARLTAPEGEPPLPRDEEGRSVGDRRSRAGARGGAS